MAGRGRKATKVAHRDTNAHDGRAPGGDPAKPTVVPLKEKMLGPDNDYEDELCPELAEILPELPRLSQAWQLKAATSLKKLVNDAAKSHDKLKKKDGTLPMLYMESPRGWSLEEFLENEYFAAGLLDPDRELTLRDVEDYDPQLGTKIRNFNSRRRAKGLPELPTKLMPKLDPRGQKSHGGKPRRKGAAPKPT